MGERHMGGRNVGCVMWFEVVLEDWLTVDRMSAPSEWVWGGVVLVVVLKWMVALGFVG